LGDRKYGRGWSPERVAYQSALWKGKPSTRRWTKEQREAMSRTIKSKGQPSPRKGYVSTPEERAKIAEALKKRFPNGREFSEETRKRISRGVKRLWERRRAGKVPMPNGFLKRISSGGLQFPLGHEDGDRSSLKFKIWRMEVFTRDGFRCRLCGSKKKIHAHHLKMWAFFPELRFDVDNGLTLCLKCHATEHPWMTGSKEKEL
jgi:hypothetical protein